MKKFTILFLTLALGQSSFAAIIPQYQDIKLPTQAVLEHQHMQNVAAANANKLLTVYAADSTGVTPVTSFLGQPDVSRNLVITPSASGGILAGAVHVVGLDHLGAPLVEDIRVTTNQTGVSTGSNAFRSIFSITFPALASPFTATWSVGTGSKLGVKRCMDRAGDVDWAELGGVREATMPTMASIANSVAGNTFQLSSTLNGSDVDLFFVQNFRCVP